MTGEWRECPVCKMQRPVGPGYPVCDHVEESAMCPYCGQDISETYEKANPAERITNSGYYCDTCDEIIYEDHYEDEPQTNRANKHERYIKA